MPGEPTNVVILARERQSYTTKRLTEVGRKMGLKLRVLAPNSLRLGLSATPKIWRNEGVLALPDVVIPRFGRSQDVYGLAVLAHMELLGVPTVNTAASVQAARDRLRCMQLLLRHGIAVPRAVLVKREPDVRDAMKRVGGLPVMLRRVSGESTSSALFCETEQGCIAAAEALWGFGHDVLVSEPLAPKSGDSVRILCLGGEVIAAIRRRARTVRTRFRLEARGKAKPFKPGSELRHIAAQVFAATGLGVCAIDLFEGPNGYRVIEANAVPGLEQLEATTGRDLTKSMLEYAMQVARGERAKAPPTAKKRRAS